MDDVDPVTYSVITNSLGEISREIENTVLQTARNSTIVLAHDFSVAVADHEGKLVSATQGIPVHLGGIDLTIQRILDDGPTMQEGDIVLTNDPYEAANTHKPDFTMVTPVTNEAGEPVLHLALRVDQADVGGKDPTRLPIDVESGYNEGILIPPIKICRDDILQQEVFDLVTRNTRITRMIQGDISSMVGALRRGRSRADELLDRYGTARLRRSTDHLISTSRRHADEHAVSLPDGTYHGESATDSNPATDERVRVRLSMTVDGDRIRMDFSDSDEQVSAPINNTLGSTHSGVNTAWYVTMDPEAPFNSGYVGPLEIIAPKGLVVNAQSPAPVGYATADGIQLVMEACFDALADALPRSTPAEWSRWVRPLTITGQQPSTGETYWGSIASVMGGGGALWEQDGPNSMGGIMALGGIVAEDPEQLEGVYPLEVHEMEFRTDSGGAGRWRGGLGPTMAVSPVDHEATFTVGGDFGQRSPPQGRLGGKPGDIVRVFKETPAGRTEYERAWQYIQLGTDDVYVQRSGGGGGVGDPHERSPEKVARDVKNGYVSSEAARSEYGTVVDPDTYEVDDASTRSLREDS